MCVECGCESVGSQSGMRSVNMMDASNGMLEPREESAAHEMAEGMVDPD
jgi:hypothetical protein